MTYVTAFLYTAGSLVCHQIPERSFHIAGAQLPVCARCTGLYVGGLIGVVVWLARRRSLSVAIARRVLAIAAVPTLVTAATGAIGWWDPTNAFRAAFALPLGLTAGALVTAVLARDLR